MPRSHANASSSFGWMAGRELYGSLSACVSIVERRRVEVEKRVWLLLSEGGSVLWFMCVIIACVG